MTPLTWQNAGYADGPAVVEWLEQEEGLCGRLDETDRKLIARWRNGCAASFRAVDRIVIGLGRHPSELPDDVWVARSGKLGAVA